MKRLAFAVVVLVGCTPDIEQYPVVPASNPPTIAQAHEPSSGATDAGVGDAGNGDGGMGDGGIGDGGIGDGGIGDGGIGDGGSLNDAGVGTDALPTAFDGGAPTDATLP